MYIRELLTYYNKRVQGSKYPVKLMPRDAYVIVIAAMPQVRRGHASGVTEMLLYLDRVVTRVRVSQWLATTSPFYKYPY